MFRLLLAAILGVTLCADGSPAGGVAAGYAGTRSCRDCHERFYSLWSTSLHGLAMRPYDAAFAQSELTPHAGEIVIAGVRYAAFVGPEEGFVRESGPDGERALPMLHVLGGKNIFYFLTSLEKGRLQTLPLAYDIHEKKWYDVAASSVRHAAAGGDRALSWTDPAFTFNTACYGCHVSQLSTNYDAQNDTYDTVWKEPGVNCETCHGSAEEHVRVCREASPGETPDDLKLRVITQEHGFTAHQVSAACAACHAKMVPVTRAFVPGEDFFQHYDLIGLEHPDFYPDGRDLGENYTYTSWLMNACAREGQLDCMHCHTSSGRYRFADPEHANEACLPCHESIVAESGAHSRHEAGSEADRCIACHMPSTRFASMTRTDHSMRAPMPAATVAFGSPNACTLCHKDQDTPWAQKHAQEWYGVEYQEETLHAATLISEATSGKWDRSGEMLRYLTREDRNAIFAASLVRLLRVCPDEKRLDTWATLLESDPSPLVRAHAAEALGDLLTERGFIALIAAAEDPYRLVRVRAAAALAPIDPEKLEEAPRSALTKATGEFLAAMNARPDDHASHYNLGLFHTDQGELEKALHAYETAVRLRPGQVAPLVNASLVYSQLGESQKAEDCLKKALAAEPDNAAANMNLGLLLGGEGRLEEAAEALERVLKVEPGNSAAAYNLGVIRGQQGKISDAVRHCTRAWESSPGNRKYAETLSYYLKKSGDTATAASVLRAIETVP